MSQDQCAPPLCDGMRVLCGSLLKCCNVHPQRPLRHPQQQNCRSPLQRLHSQHCRRGRHPALQPAAAPRRLLACRTGTHSECIAVSQRVCPSSACRHAVVYLHANSLLRAFGSCICVTMIAHALQPGSGAPRPHQRRTACSCTGVRCATAQPLLQVHCTSFPAAACMRCMGCMLLPGLNCMSGCEHLQEPGQRRGWQHAGRRHGAGSPGHGAAADGAAAAGDAGDCR
jgi:hypothetical protein